MAKKDLSTGIDAAIGSAISKRGRPKVHTHTASAASAGLAPGLIRATFVLEIVEHDRVKALSYWTRASQSEIVQKAITKFLTDYEKKNGAIAPLPEKVEL